MKRIAVLGAPNTGKSTFFNRLTGANASIGNWPGITVELAMAHVQLKNKQVEIVDLPGIYDLQGLSEDEAIVRQFLSTTPLHLVLIVINTSQIDHQIALALQVKHLHLPTVLLLNMADEAAKFGVSVDSQKIARDLGMPVVSLSAKYGQGYPLAYDAIAHTLSQQHQAVHPGPLEEQWVAKSQIAEELEGLLREAVEISTLPQETWTQRLDRVLLHPIWGLPILFGALFLTFQIIYVLAAPWQNWIEVGLHGLKVGLLEPLLSGLPPFPKAFLLEGLYDGVGTVIAFDPLITLFFFGMAVLEDSGYLSRAAFLTDGLMQRLGLDGRSFVMSLRGFGCNLPAVMGIRVMQSTNLRLLSMLILPFSLCPGRLNVFIFISAALFSTTTAPLVLVSLYGFSLVATVLTAFLLKGYFPHQESFILELPPYRFPTFKQVLLRAWYEVHHFLRWSYRFIISGVVLIWLLNHLPWNVPAMSSQTLGGMLGQATQPFMAPIGIDAQLAITLIFGVFAKEVILGGLTLIYQQMSGATDLMGGIAGQIDWVQAFSFMLFTLLYLPCLSTLSLLKSESNSTKFVLMAMVWSLGLAWTSSFIFYQSARALGF